MAPFYEEVCRDLNWPVDQKLLSDMKTANEEKLKQLEETIEDAEKNLGEMEVREANLKKSEYLCRIGDKVHIIVQLNNYYHLISCKETRQVVSIVMCGFMVIICL